MGGGLVGPWFAPFTPPSSPETKPSDSPRLETQQLQRSTSCPVLGRPIVDRFVLDLNITDINAKVEPELEPGPTFEVRLNNQGHNLKCSMAVEVDDAISNIRLEPNPVVVVNNLDKKLLLDKTILLGLLNEAKLSLQQRELERFGRVCFKIKDIEQAFIDNNKLSAEEKVWVEETITDYKRLVKGTVSESSPVPAPPTPSVISQPIAKQCFCNIL